MEELSDKELKAMDKQVEVKLDGDEIKISIFVHQGGYRGKGMTHCLTIPETHFSALLMGMHEFASGGEI